MSWRRLTNHLGWKLASLLLAVLLWFVVVGEPQLVTIQAVPVLYRNLPGGLTLISDSPEDVRAELRGPSGRFSRATLSEVFVALDLAVVTGPGEHTFTLSSSDFSLPQGITFIRAVPSQLSLNFDRVMSKEVPVAIRLSGSPPAGYRLAQQEVVPGTLKISGPETSVRKIERAQTDLVDVRETTETTPVKVNAFVADARVHFESPPTVTVTLTIEKTGKTP